MDWLELHIDTTHTGLEPVETMLSALGIDGVVIDDETEFHDFLESNRQYWDYVDENLEASMHGKSRVTFYLPADETGFAQMGEVRLALEDLKARRSDCGTLLLSLENLRDEDWENNWKQYYKPMEIGQRLLVIPQWEQVDPGQRVPLTALEKTVARGDRVLDLGCGSGILSIAALRLGASQALAVDIDDKCLDVAYENAALNGIGKDRYTVRVGDVLSDGSLRRELEGSYDIVVANIVADVIIALAPLVPSMLRPGGTFLCSGIIDDRAEEVRAALEAAGWTVLETQSADGWFAYTCRR